MKKVFPVLLGFALAFSSIAAANTITVNTTNDELNTGGDCSLREAVQSANTDTAVGGCAAGSGADIISIPAGTYVLSLFTSPSEDANASGDLDITSEITFNGEDAATTVIDGNLTDRILHMVTPNDLTVSNLTLTHGNSPTAPAIFMSPTGHLTLTNVVVDENFASGSAAVLMGGTTASMTISGSRFTNNVSSSPSAGGAVLFAATTGSLDVSDTVFSDNVSFNGTGGGLNASAGGSPVDVTLDRVTFERNSSGLGAAGGAVINTNGVITVTACHFRGNSAQNGGGLAIFGSGTATIADSEFRNNDDAGLAFASAGGGLAINGATATIRNSIFDGNASESGGGLAYTGPSLTADRSTFSGNTASAPFPSSGQGGGIFVSGNMTLVNLTFSGNQALGPSSQGGAVKGSGTSTATNVTMAGNAAAQGSSVFASGGTFTFKNSIVEDSCSQGGVTVLSAGHNIDRHNTCGFAGTGDQINTDPVLGPLADNGGGVATFALLEGSPALDAGDDAGAPVTDARGFARPADGNHDGTAVTDIGAFEVGCGDGVVQTFAGEACDDGNTAAGDGCDASCQIEEGGTTTGGTTTGGTTTGGTTTGGTTTGGSSKKSGGCSLIL